MLRLPLTPCQVLLVAPMLCENFFGVFTQDLGLYAYKASNAGAAARVYIPMNRARELLDTPTLPTSICMKDFLYVYPLRFNFSYVLIVHMFFLSIHF